MTESEYIITTNLARVRAALSIMHDVSSGEEHGIADKEYRQVISSMHKWQENLLQLAKIEPETDGE